MVKLDSLDIRGVRDGDYVDAGPGVYTTALPRPAHSMGMLSLHQVPWLQTGEQQQQQQQLGGAINVNIRLSILPAAPRIVL